MNNTRRKRKVQKSNEIDSSNDSNDFPKKIVSESDVVSSYFSEKVSNSQNFDSDMPNVAQKMITAVNILNTNLKVLKFSNPVKYIYNPAVYAFEPFKNYIERYGNGEKTILFLGMNPGPFGMSQTGVPFGEVNAVKSWLKISGKVGKPDLESPLRPVLGFDCPRSEVSGRRLWGLAQRLCDTPETFFKKCFVYNYCPLQFISEKGTNVTPADLKIQERDNLQKLCDDSLLDVIKILNSKIVVGIGLFAEKRLTKILADNNTSIKICSIPHPSPRATNNQDWENKTIKQMESLDLLQYFTK